MAVGEFEVEGVTFGVCDLEKFLADELRCFDRDFWFFGRRRIVGHGEDLALPYNRAVVARGGRDDRVVRADFSSAGARTAVGANRVVVGFVVERGSF